MQSLEQGPSLQWRAGKAVQKWLEGMAFRHFATFNFNRDTTLEGGKKSLKDFLACWDRQVLGKRFNKQPSDKRTLLIGFPEHLHSNLHYHAVVRPADNGCADQPDFAIEGPKLWKGKIPSGQLYIPKVSTDGWLPSEEGMISADHLERIAAYITKDLNKPANYEHFVVSSEFWPSSIH